MPDRWGRGDDAQTDAQRIQEFISQGSAVELAIGVILGAAFGAVVTSLVNDVLMQIVNLLIIGFMIFMVVKTVNTLRKPKAVVIIRDWLAKR